MHIKDLFWRWSPVLGWCVVIFFLSGVPHLAISHGPSDFWLRKSAHVAEYAALYVLLLRALARADGVWSWYRAVAAGGLAVGYAVSDEVHQSFVMGRHAAVIDVAIDSVGLLLGLAMAGWWRWWQAATNLPPIGAERRIEEVTLDRLGQIAEELAGQLQGGEVIALSGDLGAGKTTFVQALAASLGVVEVVTSPTFALHKVYAGQRGLQLHHYDWYRLDGTEAVRQLGVEDIWRQPGSITVIEWPERATAILPEHIKIHIDYVDATTRRLIINS